MGGKAAGILLLMAVSFACGCAATPPVTEQVWPPSPARARIRYVRSIYDDSEVKGAAFKRWVSRSSPMQIKKPYGVFSDDRGRVYVADTAWGLILVLDYTQGRSFFIGGENGNGRLAKPVNVIADGSGNVYVVDALQKRLVIYDANGKFLNAIGRQGEFERPTGIALDEEKSRIYVSDTLRHVVRAYDAGGKFQFEFRGDSDQNVTFHDPTNIWVDKAGSVYVTDSMNFRILVFDADGRYIKKIGRIGVLPGMFARPRGVAVDSEGHIYVVDAMFHNVQIFDQEGRLLLGLGKFGSGAGEFWLPAGICIDREDFIYVSDSLNHRIQVFQYLH
ncbi:6-bladed beta-propeller [Candidatus Poribacteria bacterium]|nr:6-bladed beta-propeller [Candidatus Poribacteria bacterium]